jgi:voltage-gated potassium channel
MLATVIALRQLFLALGRAIRDPATRGLVALTAMILLCGTLFYRGAEGWRILDAFYFSVVTLTTIGFGDLAPTTDLAKVFTVVYSLVGIGVLASFVASLAVFARADVEKHGRLRPRRRRDDDRGPADAAEE